MIGTCHFPWHGSPRAFHLTEAMVQGYIDQINTAHPPLQLSLRDVRQVTWGFLPVNLEDANQVPVRLTRDGVLIDHQRRDGVSGLISILGVKYTTARMVAEQAVDLAVCKLGAKAKECQTHTTPVIGGEIDDFSAFLHRARADVAGVVDERFIQHLVYTYGSEYKNLAQRVIEQPVLARRIAPPLAVTAAEVKHAVQHEMALTLADVVQRRTELGSTGLPSLAALQECARLLSREFEWTSEHEQQEIESVIQSYPFRQTEAIAA